MAAPPKDPARKERSRPTTQTEGAAASGRLRAPLLDASGNTMKNLTLEQGVFGAEIKPYLVHEVVRAELNAARSGTRGGKSRGEVSGGRGKPWRQKGTGRARAGTIRAPHFTGGGIAFPPQARKFDAKVNRKAKKAALRAALTSQAAAGTFGVLDGSAFDDEPSTRQAAALLGKWGKELPVVVVVTDDDAVLAKSFRNLDRVLVVSPAELEVSAVVWARSLLVSEAALESVQKRAGA